MPKKEISPLEIYKLLPKTNCRECGVATCMAFATKTVIGEIEWEKCPYLTSGAKDKLKKMLTPPVRPITIGIGEKAVKVGGEEVLYRHQKKFNNATALAITICDNWTTEEIEKTILNASKFTYERLGEILKIDMAMVLSKDKTIEAFERTVRNVKALGPELPLILSSDSPEIIEAGLCQCKGEKALIHGATKENLANFAELAVEFDSPLALKAKNIEEAYSLVKKISDLDISSTFENLILDLTSESLSKTLENLVLARGLAVKFLIKEFSYPTMAIPALNLQVAREDEDLFKVLTICIEVLRYASIVPIQGIELRSMLPVIVLRNNIYTDPRRPAQVKSGLYIHGTTNENSPVLITTNYSLSFYSVLEEVKAANISCYIVVIDTEGLSVVTSIAGNKLTTEKISETLSKCRLEEKVKHKTLIVPPVVARLAGEIEDRTGCRVIIGPSNIKKLPDFLKDTSLL